MNKLLFFIFVIVMLFLVAPKLKPSHGHEVVWDDGVWITREEK